MMNAVDLERVKVNIFRESSTLQHAFRTTFSPLVVSFRMEGARGVEAVKLCPFITLFLSNDESTLR